MGGHIQTVKLKKAWINAVPCMTINEHDVKILNCKQTFEDIADDQTQSMMVACPTNCKKNVKMFGKNIFSVQSSVCKAVTYSNT